MIEVEATPRRWPIVGPVAPAEAALLVIDMQADFVEPAGWLAAIGVDVRAMAEAVGPIRRLLAAARAAGVLVVHTRQGNAADLSDLSPARRAVRASRNDAGPAHGVGLVRHSSGWQIVEALAPEEGELVIDKTGFSAFAGTGLTAALQLRGVTSLIVCGVTANVCVLASLFDAVDAGFDCLLVTDAIAADAPAVTAATIAIVEHEGLLWGARATVAQVVGALTSRF